VEQMFFDENFISQGPEIVEYNNNNMSLPPYTGDAQITTEQIANNMFKKNLIIQLTIYL